MLKSTYEKHKHLIDAQINKWTILDIIEHRGKDKGYIYAKCRCVCGTIRDVRLSKLLNGDCQDCGCGHQDRLKDIIKRKYEHLVGTTINGWTILEIIPPNDKHTSAYSMCECQCGTIKEVKLSYILCSKSKDCGCGRKETLRETFTKNLIGKRFGRLVVLEMLEDRNKHGRILYRCKCDCGNEVIALAYCLTQHHTSSCGCLNSYYNMYIKQFLNENKVENKPEYTISIGEKYYRFDFYLPQYNLFIEYDGEQHFKPIRYYTQSDDEVEQNFQSTQEHDKIKNKYCEDNHINLLRIPYWEKENIEEIISNHLQRLNEKGFAESA